ncbi:GroES-like protein [Mytilinidion resinicola]|uniref:GroES-like protein n=1 Tax=Mytilinidion resinicola TaxID=574789 RepID=A0A6A6Z7K2_9PEZI|nr:GroES-like protein [Mytilinidion resinicola]KAF2816284.1 GroES-like protein [Mytilinidion resinicola]
MSNQAAWIKSEGANLTLDSAETPAPTANQLLIKTGAIGLNPVEAKLQKFKIFPIPYPNILGLSFSGTVEKVGSSVTDFKAGDRVAVHRSSGHSTGPVGPFEHSSTGSYQKYVIADSQTTAKLEDNVTFEAAAAAITNLATAVSALAISLKLDRPNPKGPNPANEGKKVLIYGGSSSVGGFAVHFAVRAGYTIITTSSPRNLATVTSLHPAKIIDHTQPASSIVEELKAAGPYHAVFDTIGLPTTTTILGQVLAEQGGELYATQPPFGPLDLPSNVQRHFGSFPAAFEQPENEEYRNWFYGIFGKYLGMGLVDE